MKFAAVAVLAFATSTAALMPSAKLLKSARRLEENENEDEAAEEEEYAFLSDYKLKLVSCKTGEVYVNPENGENEYSSVVFRLCPSTNGCDDEGNTGCSSGYGDYVIGLNSFVQEYLEQKKEEMNGDDDGFNMEEFGECREYEVDQDAEDGDDEDEAEQAAYFVGPACMEDGTGVKLALFQDEDCLYTTEEVTFEEISNGVALPYSDGGLVSNYCESCSVVNDDGEYELAEMCTNLYQDAGKCEVNMETFHYAGQQVGSCEFIEEMIPRKSAVGAGKVIGWLFFVAFIVGGGYVAYTMFNKKDDKTASLMNA